MQLGEASIVVAAPEGASRRAAWAAWQRGEPYDPNQIATVLDVSWRGQHVILGSDLVEQPGRGWTSAQPRCGIPIATKVPHHGSTNALHASWIRGGPHLVVTPFASSNLPRFDSAGGVAHMLDTVDQIQLTALPRAYTEQAGAPLRLTRKQLERLGDERLDPPMPGWPDCYVILSIAADGSTRLAHGPGSIQVTEAGRASRPRRRVVGAHRART